MKVEVVDYDENWLGFFEYEAETLKEIFSDKLVDIFHIGSTSVPQLQAKPIIDIMPVVRRIEQVDVHHPQMERIGYECMGEFGIPGRRFFRKGGNTRTHHVHVFAADDDNVRRHLAFRDYLRTHRDDATRYGLLKSKLAKRFPQDIEAYMDGKDALVKEIETRALAWYQKKNL